MPVDFLGHLNAAFLDAETALVDIDDGRVVLMGFRDKVTALGRCIQLTGKKITSETFLLEYFRPFLGFQ